MKIWGSLVAGVVLLLVGLVWTLQGLGVFSQSGGMNGKTAFAIIGPIVGIAGLALLGIGVRARRRA